MIPTVVGRPFYGELLIGVPTSHRMILKTETRRVESRAIGTVIRPFTAIVLSSCVFRLGDF